MKFLSTPLFCGLALSLVTTPALAQGSGHGRFHKQFRVQHVHNLQSNEIVYLDFADLNSDGYPELLYADPYFQTDRESGFDTGRVFVYDGKTGAELYDQQGQGSGARLGVNARFLEDMNGDGVQEIAFIDHYQFSYHLHIRSGADFSALINSPQFQPFYNVISIGDRTADGISELAAVRYSNPFGPSLEILDGSDFSLLQRKSIADVGIQLARLGDLDGDGLEEIGASFLLNPFGADQGQILRGSNLGTMQRFSAEVSTMSVLAPAGDVDADGTQDILMGNPYSHYQGIDDSGLVQVVSGATGTVLATHYGASQDRIGGYMASMGDLNGDGHAEYLLGSKLLTQGEGFGNHPQEVRLFSGSTHAELTGQNARNTFTRHGSRSLAVSAATPTQKAFIGFADSFQRRFGSPMTTRLDVFRFGN